MNCSKFINAYKDKIPWVRLNVMYDRALCAVELLNKKELLCDYEHSRCRYFIRELDAPDLNWRIYDNNATYWNEHEEEMHKFYVDVITTAYENVDNYFKRITNKYSDKYTDEELRHLRELIFDYSQEENNPSLQEFVDYIQHRRRFFDLSKDTSNLHKIFCEMLDEMRSEGGLRYIMEIDA